jgi:hypothetical protein
MEMTLDLHDCCLTFPKALAVVAMLIKALREGRHSLQMMA